MRIEDKLTILADAAKYDVSCASSGSRRKNSGRRLGNAAPSGICHTYTEDGRCVSLLKILFTNVCIYDCEYCVNRCSNDTPRAAFTSRDIVDLTIDFYRRNYIEGLFLSSGVARSPDDTMERLVHTVQTLRHQGFNGYVHLKCVPFASRRLIRQAGRYADRLSVNIELPSEESLKRLTRAKTYPSVLTPMGVIRETIAETREDRKRLRRVPAFAPAGQSTQLIVGASPESDFDVLQLANRLYQGQALKRVYYSAYVPVAAAQTTLPVLDGPPLVRENRLYQADWLMRLYGFSLDEVINRSSPWLDLNMDPKQAFALRHPELFPVDINRAAREMILRVPGIGIKSANRIVSLRRKGRIRIEHLRQLGAIVSRARPFIRCDGLPPEQWPVNETTAGTASAHVRRPSVQPAAPAVAPGRTVFETDGSFDGLLCATVDAFKAVQPPDAIVPPVRGQQDLFERRIPVTTDTDRADRVWRGLKRRLGNRRRQKLFDAFLSGHSGVENLIYGLITSTISTGRKATGRPDLQGVIQIDQLSRKVRLEAHRMKGLIRFTHTRDGGYLALIAPRYDVLPLVRGHFESRYADQRWMIVDTHRGYGLCYDGRGTREVQVDMATLQKACDDPSREEQSSRRLWQRYYAAVTIAARRNPRLHQNKLPRRYWRYLTEKQPGRRTVRRPRLRS
jgi:probable DNA metabolism protein